MPSVRASLLAQSVTNASGPFSFDPASKYTRSDSASSPRNSCWNAFSILALVSAGACPCSANKARYACFAYAPAPSPGIRGISPSGALTCGGGGTKPPRPGPGLVWAGGCPNAVTTADRNRTAGKERRREWTDKELPPKGNCLWNMSSQYASAPIPLQLGPFSRVKNYCVHSQDGDHKSTRAALDIPYQPCIWLHRSESPALLAIFATSWRKIASCVNEVVLFKDEQDRYISNAPLNYD